MPERGRNGRFCLPPPLHAPRSPSTYTAVDVQQYVSYRSTYVGTEVVPVSCRDVQQHMRWYRYSVGMSFFFIFTILRYPGERVSCPREGASPRPPLAESGIGARSFAWDPES